jgi:hypothetical protein
MSPMNDFGMSRPAVWMERTTTRGPRGRVAELLTIVVELMLISSVAYAVGGLMGPGNFAPLAAMGIAIHISTLHFKALRAEIQTLRATVRRCEGTFHRSTGPASRRASRGESSRAV